MYMHQKTELLHEKLIELKGEIAKSTIIIGDSKQLITRNFTVSSVGSN